VYNFCDYSSKKKNSISNTSRLPLVSRTDKEKKIHNFNIHGTFPLEKVFFKEEKKNILKVIKIFFTPIKKGPVSELFTESVFGEPTNSFYMALIQKKKKPF